MASPFNISLVQNTFTDGALLVSLNSTVQQPIECQKYDIRVVEVNFNVIGTDAVATYSGIQNFTITSTPSSFAIPINAATMRNGTKYKVTIRLYSSSLVYSYTTINQLYYDSRVYTIAPVLVSSNSTETDSVFDITNVQVFRTTLDGSGNNVLDASGNKVLEVIPSNNQFFTDVGVSNIVMSAVALIKDVSNNVITYTNGTQYSLASVSSSVFDRRNLVPTSYRFKITNSLTTDYAYELWGYLSLGSQFTSVINILAADITVGYVINNPDIAIALGDVIGVVSPDPISITLKNWAYYNTTHMFDTITLDILNENGNILSADASGNNLLTYTKPSNAFVFVSSDSSGNEVRVVKFSSIELNSFANNNPLMNGVTYRFKVTLNFTNVSLYTPSLVRSATKNGQFTDEMLPIVSGNAVNSWQIDSTKTDGLVVGFKKTTQFYGTSSKPYNLEDNTTVKAQYRTFDISGNSQWSNWKELSGGYIWQTISKSITNATTNPITTETITITETLYDVSGNGMYKVPKYTGDDELSGNIQPHVYIYAVIPTKQAKYSAVQIRLSLITTNTAFSTQTSTDYDVPRVASTTYTATTDNNAVTFRYHPPPVAHNFANDKPICTSAGNSIAFDVPLTVYPFYKAVVTTSDGDSIADITNPNTYDASWNQSVACIGQGLSYTPAANASFTLKVKYVSIENSAISVETPMTVQRQGFPSNSFSINSCRWDYPNQKINYELDISANSTSAYRMDGWNVYTSDASNNYNVSYNAFDDFISGSTPQSTSNVWQYLEVNTDRSTASLLSNWQNGNDIISTYGQWDNNRTGGSYPFVQKVTGSGLINSGSGSSFTGPALVMHPDSSSINVGMGFKNTTGSTINVNIDLALSLLFPDRTVDGVNYFIQRGLLNDARYELYANSTIPPNSSTFTFNKTNIELRDGEFIYLILNRVGLYDWDFTKVVFNVVRTGNLLRDASGNLVRDVYTLQQSKLLSNGLTQNVTNVNYPDYKNIAVTFVATRSLYLNPANFDKQVETIGAGLDTKQALVTKLPAVLPLVDASGVTLVNTVYNFNVTDTQSATLTATRPSNAIGLQIQNAPTTTPTVDNSGNVVDISCNIPLPTLEDRLTKLSYDIRARYYSVDTPTVQFVYSNAVTVSFIPSISNRAVPVIKSKDISGNEFNVRYDSINSGTWRSPNAILSNVYAGIEGLNAYTHVGADDQSINLEQFKGNIVTIYVQDKFTTQYKVDKTAATGTANDFTNKDSIQIVNSSPSATFVLAANPQIVENSVVVNGTNKVITVNVNNMGTPLLDNVLLVVSQDSTNNENDPGYYALAYFVKATTGFVNKLSGSELSLSVSDNEVTGMGKVTTLTFSSINLTLKNNNPVNVVLFVGNIVEGSDSCAVTKAIVYPYAAPVISGRVAYAAGYTATAIYTFNTNVSAIKVMKSDGTTIFASQAVSSGTATIVIPYTDADISGTKSFYVVALGNSFAPESMASASQLLIVPPPPLPPIFYAGTVSVNTLTKQSEFAADLYNRNLAFDASGKIWVGNTNGASQYTASGASLGRSLGGGGGHAIDADGNIWVSDVALRRVRKMNGLTLVELIELRNGYYKLNGYDQADNANVHYNFSSPSSIAIDMQGNVYVLDGGAKCVKKFTKDGFYISTIIPVTGEYQRGMTVSKDGSIYVVHSHGGYLTKYNPNGVEVYTVITPGGRNSITTDSEGNPWLTGNTSFFKYSQIDGSVLREITNTGQLNNPGGIAIDSTGKIYVSAPSNVQIWS
jgi:hypothetical protein